MITVKGLKYEKSEKAYVKRGVKSNLVYKKSFNQKSNAKLLL